jgi:hypothetical protein
MQIRRSLGLSQGEMVQRPGVQELIHYTTLSKYELEHFDFRKHRDRFLPITTTRRNTHRVELNSLMNRSVS